MAYGLGPRTQIPFKNQKPYCSSLILGFYSQSAMADDSDDWTEICRSLAGRPAVSAANDQNSDEDEESGWDAVTARLVSTNAPNVVDGSPDNEEETNEWDVVAARLVSSCGSAHDQQNIGVVTSPSVATVVPVEFGELMYGTIQSVSEIGNDLQKSIFRAFRTSAKRPDRAQQSTWRWEELVRKGHGVGTFRTQIQISHAAGKKSASGTMATMAQVACLLLYGTAWLIGTFFSAWCDIFAKKKYQPIVSVSRVKYDETPLKLRVKDYESVMGCPLPAAFQNRQKQKRTSLMSNDETYCHAKILRVLWKYGL